MIHQLSVYNFRIHQFTAAFFTRSIKLISMDFNFRLPQMPLIILLHLTLSNKTICQDSAQGPQFRLPGISVRLPNISDSAAESVNADHFYWFLNKDQLDSNMYHSELKCDSLGLTQVYNKFRGTSMVYFPGFVSSCVMDDFGFPLVTQILTDSTFHEITYGLDGVPILIFFCDYTRCDDCKEIHYYSTTDWTITDYKPILCGFEGDFDDLKYECQLRKAIKILEHHYANGKYYSTVDVPLTNNFAKSD